MLVPRRLVRGFRLVSTRIDRFLHCRHSIWGSIYTSIRFFPRVRRQTWIHGFSSVLTFQCSKLRVIEHDLFILSLIVILLSVLIGVATGLYWIPICVILLGYLLLLTYLVKKRDLPTQEGGAQQTRLRRRDTTRWSSLIVRANRIRALQV